MFFDEKKNSGSAHSYAGLLSGTVTGQVELAGLIIII